MIVVKIYMNTIPFQLLLTPLNEATDFIFYYHIHSESKECLLRVVVVDITT